MSILRSRRLESVFGAAIDEVTASHIQSLVENGITESFDLDFKEALYGRSDSEKRDLAGDVAALANTAGGVIVIGVAEDDQARANKADGVPLSDAERTRMLQVIASGVSPLPAVDIHAVPTTSTTTGEESTDSEIGYFLVAVPRSQAAPHAVIVNDGLRFPKRNGSTTRYLSEPEVAAEYRDRFARVSSQGEQIERVERELLTRLNTTEMPWLVVSLVPDLAGDLELTHAVRQTFTQEVLQKEVRIGLPIGISFFRARVGRRRLFADGSRDNDASSRWAAAELHCDGAGAFAQYVADLRADSPTPDRSVATEQLVSDEGLVLAVMSGLHHLARHARDRAATAGSALVKATLVPSDGCTMEIGHNRHFRDSRSSVPAAEAVTAESVADIDDLADPGPELVAAAGRLADELAQSFGIAELGQFSRDGEIRIRYWDTEGHSQLRAWAEAHGVTVTEEALD